MGVVPSIIAANVVFAELVATVPPAVIAANKAILAELVAGGGTGRVENFETHNPFIHSASDPIDNVAAIVGVHSSILHASDFHFGRQKCGPGRR
jgi:hypothetical protein